jgi:mannobiose 2-epimerase
MIGPGVIETAHRFAARYMHGRELVSGISTIAALFAATVSFSSANGETPAPAIPAHASIPAPVTLAEIDDYIALAKNELLNDILPYWERNAPNPANGGFYGVVGPDNKPDASAPRGALLSARILWTCSAAYRLTKDPACLDMARRAKADLDHHFYDAKNGGLVWALKADGSILDARKIAYGQSFGIYGYSEYYRATGDRDALERAVALYRNMETHARDRANGGYREEFSADWKVLKARGFRSSAIGSTGDKSQNVHIHILEAYTNLYRAWPDESLRHDLCSLQDVLFDKILNASTHHLTLFLSEDWKAEDHAVSYGHDIEFSWLLVESAEVLNDPARLAKAKAAAMEIARVTAAEGVDKDGALFNEGGPRGVTDGTKDWWPQAEAAVGFVNAWTISGDPKYFRLSRASWNFIETRLVDRKGGEWFWGTDRAGNPEIRDKISFWKCPYHNSRACMELIARLEAAKTAQTPAK